MKIKKRKKYNNIIVIVKQNTPIKKGYYQQFVIKVHGHIGNQTGGDNNILKDHYTFEINSPRCHFFF